MLRSEIATAFPDAAVTTWRPEQPLPPDAVPHPGRNAVLVLDEAPSALPVERVAAATARAGCRLVAAYPLTDVGRPGTVLVLAADDTPPDLDGAAPLDDADAATRYAVTSYVLGRQVWPARLRDATLATELVTERMTEQAEADLTAARTEAQARISALEAERDRLRTMLDETRRELAQARDAVAAHEERWTSVQASSGYRLVARVARWRRALRRPARGPVTGR